MADGADPAGIIAFTFTERAADELKARISARVEERLGPASLDKLGAAFMGDDPFLLLPADPAVRITAVG
jgi:DNA helicase II / ATP-dependent DNA helicase PcrA